MKFVAGDIFDDAFLAPAAPESAVHPAAATTLTALRGRADAVHASSFSGNESTTTLPT